LQEPVESEGYGTTHSQSGVSYHIPTLSHIPKFKLPWLTNPL